VSIRSDVGRRRSPDIRNLLNGGNLEEAMSTARGGVVLSVLDRRTLRPNNPVPETNSDHEEGEEPEDGDRKCGCCCMVSASMVAIECGHLFFCERCLKKNISGGMSQSRNCPICRVETSFVKLRMST